MELAHLDAQIDRLERELANLKRKRNDIVAIAQLPLEILCKIFVEIRGQSGKGFSKKMAWIAATTRVCSRWRSAAIECPMLWSNINFRMSNPWIKACLQRSMDALISIRMRRIKYDKIYEGKEQLLHNAFKQSHRLEEVFLSWEILGGEEELQRYFSPLQSSAPFLRRLSVLRTKSFQTKSILRLPDGFFNDHTPRLRSLNLEGCHLPWSSGLFQGLTILRIDIPDTDRPADISLTPTSQIIQALSTMPSLTNLTLHIPSSFLVPSSNSSEAHTDTIITLPFLESLDLRSDHAFCVRVLDSIRPPTRSSLYINCVDVEEIGLRSIASSLRSAWCSNHPSEVRVDDSSYTPLLNLGLQLWLNGATFTGNESRLTASTSLPLHDQPQARSFRLSIFPTPGMNWPAGSEIAILYALPLHEVEALSVGANAYNDAPNGVDSEAVGSWCRLMPNLTSLKEVHLTISDARAFFTSLKANIDIVRRQSQSGHPIVAGEVSEPLYLHSLEQIWLDVALDAMAGPPDIPIDILADVLHFRMNHGLPKLKKLRLDLYQHAGPLSYATLDHLVDHIDYHELPVVGDGWGITGTSGWGDPDGWGGGWGAWDGSGNDAWGILSQA